jgi:MFS family permease
VPARVLPVTVAVLFASSAVFFAGSGAAPELARAWGLGPGEAAALSWAVQLGFIAGTLLTAGLNLPDRFPPSRLVAVLLLASAAVNAAFTRLDHQLPEAVALRFLAGAIAGPVYPIAMKLLATWHARLGWQLGVLIGFSSVGYGAVFFLRAAGLAWQASVLGASALAALGALLALALLHEGPLLPARSPFDLRAAARAFREPGYRNSALAYFGHMWELFAFWALLPFWLAEAGLGRGLATALAGGVFLTGAAGCALGGRWSRRVGEARVARLAMAASGLLCLLSPWLFDAPAWLVAGAVLLWGAAVIADSPMFSAVSARAAPRGYVGTALTAQNAIGFAVTLGSIALLPAFAAWQGSWRFAFLLLAPGPLLGLVPITRLARAEPAGLPDPAPA